MQTNRGDWHLKITFENLVFGTMSKKIVNIVSSILLFLPLLVGVLLFHGCPRWAICVRNEPFEE